MINPVKKILLVDDEERLLNSMGQRLALMGFEVVKASSGTKAVELSRKTQLDLAIVDLKMPDMDGLMTISKLQKITPDLKTILLTGYGSKTIQKETKALGSDYFEKDSMGDLWDLIKEFNSQGSVVVINPSSSNTISQSGNEYKKDDYTPSRIDVLHNQYKQEIDKHIPGSNVDSIGRSFGDLPRIIGETPEMQGLRKKIKRLSELDCTIVIQGETGTGKELIARVIHALSHRKDQRFLAFSCSCFSNDFHFKELLSSLDQPFSHQNLQKTGTTQKGFVGTILLDNFETMPEQTQREMIRIIDSNTLGLSKDKVETLMDIRFIVATHHDLKKRVVQGKFNKDLYRRLNTISLEMPSLRNRREDIAPLCYYFLDKLNIEFKKKIKFITDEVFSIFMTYPFPGNVRELKHIIERAVILADSTTIELQHLPERFSEKRKSSVSIGDKQFLTLNEMEQNHILKALKLTKGNKLRATELLGISRGALWRKLKLINTDK